MNINNLTIVESLTLNALKWRFNRKNPDKWLYGWHELTGIGLIKKAAVTKKCGSIDYAISCRERLKSNKTSWIHRVAFENACRKVGYPAVKLPGYTRKQALKEARETIAWVKRKYQEAR